MSDRESRVLARRANFLVASKPAGMPTLPEAGFSTSLVAELAREAQVPASDLHAHNRLDVGVSGAVLLSLRDARAKRGPVVFRRFYVGITSSVPEPEQGEWSFSIGRGSRGSRAVGGAGAVPALTEYRVVAKVSSAALVRFELRTGRTHQIRVHTAHVGAPLYGDRRYGGPRRLVHGDGSVIELERIALHAATLELELPGEPLRATAPLPPELAALWQRLGGSEAAWDAAFSC